MLRKPMTAGLMATALMMGPAFAQSSAPAQNASANAGKFVTQQTPNHWRASKLVGVVVYGTNNERIGDINEVLIDRNGDAEAVVIGVGGFLGIGEKDVALPFKSVEWRTSDMDRTAANTTAAPGAPGTTAPPANTTGSTRTETAPSAAADANRGYPASAMVRMSKADLENAPTFRYAGSTDASSSRDAPARTGTGTTAPTSGTTAPTTGAPAQRP